MFLAEILGRLGKENPSERRCKISVCMQGSREYDCCPVPGVSTHSGHLTRRKAVVLGRGLDQRHRPRACHASTTRRACRINDSGS